MEQERRHDILEYVIEITEQRDAELLEESIVRTIYELFGTDRVCLFRTRGGSASPYCAVRMDASGLSVIAEGGALDALRRELEGALSAALESRTTVCVSEECRQVIALPVIVHKRITGFITVCAPPGAAVDRRIIEGLTRIYSNYLTLLLESQRDRLTGLMNRKTFDDQVLKILEYIRKEGCPGEPPDSRRHAAAPGTGFWLGMIDIDDFKSVNDTFGHLYGDEVLILLAKLMCEEFRSQDLLFRFGGEEFLVILSTNSETFAPAAFERFRAAVKHSASPVERVTVSIGLAGIGFGETPTDFIGHADQALYYAKQHGKNRLCIYDRLVREGALKKDIRYSDVEFF